MLGRKQRMLEAIVKSLSISVSDLTNQVELLKNELDELRAELKTNKSIYVSTKDLKSKKRDR